MLTTIIIITAANVLYYYLFMKCKYVSAGAFDLYSKVDSLNFAFVVLVSSTKVTLIVSTYGSRNCFNIHSKLVILDITTLSCFGP